MKREWLLTLISFVVIAIIALCVVFLPNKKDDAAQNSGLPYQATEIDLLKKLEEQSSRLDSQEKQLAAIDTDLAGKATQIESLSSDSTKQASQIESLKADYDKIAPQIEKLNDSVATLQSNSISAKINIDALLNQADVIESSAAFLETTKSELSVLRQEVFDSSGVSRIENIEVPAGNDFTTLYTISLKAGIPYTVSLQLSSPLPDGEVYAYLLDDKDQFVESDGSLFGIMNGSTSGSATVRFNNTYNNLRFAVSCSTHSFIVSSASITYSPDDINDLTVPSYYFQNNYLDTKIARINELAAEAGAEGDVFIFITDTHLTQNVQNSPALIKYISEHTHIPRLFDGGDSYDYGSDLWPKTIRKAFGGKAYFLMGNHEYFNKNSSELYYWYDIMSENQIGNPDRHYYYVDDAQGKTRYIVLSPFSSPTPDQEYDGAHEGLEPEQIDWLKTTALDVQPGWTIIIFSHGIYYGDFDTHEWIPLSFSQDLFDVVDNYTGNGKIAFMMQGHLHADGINYTPGGIPVIATTCDKQEHWINHGKDMEEFLNNRIVGTTTEQAFDVIIHNKSTRTIYCVRIGGFSTFDGIGNEELAQKGERVFSY